MKQGRKLLLENNKRVEKNSLKIRIIGIPDIQKSKFNEETMAWEKKS